MVDLLRHEDAPIVLDLNALYILVELFGLVVRGLVARKHVGHHRLHAC